MSSLSTLSTARHRVLTAAELHGAGVSVSRLRTAVRTGEWLRMFHGVYALPPLDEEWATVVARAATAYAGRGSAVTHLTRLALVGVHVDAAEPAHVAVERPRGVRATTGLVVHSTVQLRLDVAGPPGLPLVPVGDAARLAYATTADLGSRRALVCELAALRAGDLDVLAAEAPRGLRHRRELGETCRYVASGCESPREIEYLVDVEIRHRLPPGRRQVVIAARGFRYRVDVLYERWRLIVEIDGRHHEHPDQAAADARRDADLRVLGYRVLRVTGADLRRPDLLAARVRALLAAAA